MKSGTEKEKEELQQRPFICLSIVVSSCKVNNSRTCSFQDPIKLTSLIRWETDIADVMSY